MNISVVQSQAHQSLSLKAALESMVLLKNIKGRGLPISGTVEKACVSLVHICYSITVIINLSIFLDKVVGPFIDECKYLYGDYAPEVMVSVGYVNAPVITSTNYQLLN